MRNLTLGILAALGSAVLVLILLLSVSLATSTVDRQAYRDKVATAISSGELGKRAFFFSHGQAPHFYNHNDCLILSMLVLETGDRAFRRAISPPIPSVPWSKPLDQNAPLPSHGMCAGLVVALEEPTSPHTLYHRYIHGTWVLTSALLSFLSVGTASALLQLISYGLLIGTVGAAGRRLLSYSRSIIDRDPERTRVAALMVVATTVALFYGLNVFGGSFSFAPSDIVIFGVLLAALKWPSSRMTDAGLAVFAGMFGALIAAFEFLHGALPSALAVFLFLLATDDQISGKQVAQKSLFGMLCFLTAAAFAFGAKNLFVLAVWSDSESTVAVVKLLQWSSGDTWEVAPENLEMLRGISVDTIKYNRLFGFLFALAKMVYFSPMLTFGLRPLGFLIVGVLPALFVIFGFARLARGRDADSRLRELAALCAGLGIYLWYFLFLSHAIVHAYFMSRALVWVAAFFIASEVKRWLDSQSGGRGRAPGH